MSLMEALSPGSGAGISLTVGATFWIASPRRIGTWLPSSTTGEALTSAPAALKPADNERVAFVWQAVGAQIYECRQDAGKMAWVFVAPEAELLNDKGDKVGTHGADIVSVNTVTGEVTLWDSKFLSGERRIGESTTFSGATTREAAKVEAISAIGASDLTMAQKQLATSKVQAGDFVTKTVGSGNAKNSVIVRYCGGSPC